MKLEKTFIVSNTRKSHIFLHPYSPLNLNSKYHVIFINTWQFLLLFVLFFLNTNFFFLIVLRKYKYQKTFLMICIYHKYINYIYHGLVTMPCGSDLMPPLCYVYFNIKNNRTIFNLRIINAAAFNLSVAF